MRLRNRNEYAMRRSCDHGRGGGASLAGAGFGGATRLGSGNPDGSGGDWLSGGSTGFRTSRTFSPAVSIISTVYDRVHCLQDCVKSVKQLNFRDYEHIIVADCPPKKAIRAIQQIIEQEDNGRIQLVNLHKRYNNWGIAPASAGPTRCPAAAPSPSRPG